MIYDWSIFSGYYLYNALDMVISKWNKTARALLEAWDNYMIETIYQFKKVIGKNKKLI